MTTRIISGRNLLRQYNELKAAGWTTVWAGNGRICLRAPKPGAEIPKDPVVVVEVRAGAEVTSNGNYSVAATLPVHGTRVGNYYPEGYPCDAGWYPVEGEEKL